MSSQNVCSWLLVALCASVAAMVASAGLELPILAISAAGLFALAVLAVGFGYNRRLWALDASRVSEQTVRSAARRNGGLMAVAFGWGAITIFAVYWLTALRWYHYWQYGTAMMLLALAAFGIAARVGRIRDRGRLRLALQVGLQLTIIQGAAAAAGLVFLVQSGKLMTFRPDWIANVVFLFGGLAIAGLSAIAATVQRKLLRVWV